MNREFRLNKKEILIFFEQMSFLLKSSLQVQDCLEVLSSMAGRKVRTLCIRIKKEVAEGIIFSEAAKGFVKSVGENFLYLLKVGEESGRLGEVFSSYYEWLSEKMQMHKKIKQALVYPCLVLMTLIFAGAIIFIYVVPELAGIFEVFGEGSAEVKSETQRLLAGIVFRGCVIGFLIAATVVLLIFYRKNSKCRYWFDSFFIKFPFAGKYVKEVCIEDFSFSMKVLSESCVPLVKSIELSAKTVKNRYFSFQVNEAARKIRTGMKVQDAFKEADVFPEYFISWISLSNVTGDLELSFKRIHSYYREEIKERIKVISSSFESIFIFITGSAVLDFTVNFVLPLFNLIGRL